MVTKDNKLTIDLFHCTSTLFLDSIIHNGLGSVNPIDEWKLLELSKEVYILSIQHLKETKLTVEPYLFCPTKQHTNMS